MWSKQAVLLRIQSGNSIWLDHPKHRWSPKYHLKRGKTIKYLLTKSLKGMLVCDKYWLSNLKMLIQSYVWTCSLRIMHIIPLNRHLHMNADIQIWRQGARSRCLKHSGFFYLLFICRRLGQFKSSAEAGSLSQYPACRYVLIKICNVALAPSL